MIYITHDFLVNIMIFFKIKDVHGTIDKNVEVIDNYVEKIHSVDGGK